MSISISDVASFVQQYPHYQTKYLLPRTNAAVVFVPHSLELTDSFTMPNALAAYEHIIMIVESDARVTISSIWQGNTTQTISIYMHAHAYVDWAISMTQASVATYKIRVCLEEQGASFLGNIIYLAQDADTINLTCEQHHCAPASTSSVVCKGVVFGQARVNYQGTITIEKNEGSAIQASQEHSALVLSEQARVHSTPSLQAHTNKVRCKHATSISHINQEYIWYMKMRGITDISARYLIIEGFCMFNNKTSTVYNAFKQQLQRALIVFLVVFSYSLIV